MKHFFGPFLEGLGSHSVTILGSKSHLKIDQKINAILDRFWNDFGPKLEAKLGPSWAQNPSQIQQTTDPKKIIFLNMFLIDLGSVLGPKKWSQSGDKMVDFNIELILRCS